MGEGTAKKTRRTWYRFSFRTLLVLVIGFSAIAGMLGRRQRYVRRQRTIVDQLLAAGGNVYFDYQQTANGIDTNRTDAPVPPEYLGLDPEFYVNVIHVDLSGREVTPELVELVSELKYLEDLRLQGTAVDDEPLSAIGRRCHKLRRLDLLKTKVQGPGLAKLKDLHELQDIYLDGTSIADQHLAFLRNHPQIETVSLFGTRVGDGCLPDLLSCQHLTTLNLNFTNLTPAGIIQISEKESLRHLLIGGLSDLGDAECEHLAKMQDLETLYLGFNNITDAGVDQLQNLGELRELYLTNTQISDECVDSILRLPKLEILAIENTSLSDDALSALGQLGSLKELRVGGTLSTAVGRQKLSAARPKLKIQD